MKHMINFSNFSKEELNAILDLAYDMKKNPEKYSETLKGKKLYTLFEKTSTRTFYRSQQELQSLADIISTSFGKIRISYLESLFQRLNMSAEMLISSWRVL